MIRTRLRLPTADGHRVAAQVRSGGPTARGVALIVGGIGIGQVFYEDFATWLAARGWDAITFDFRGIGDSAPTSLRGFEADLQTWIRQDCATVLAFAQAQAAGRPLYWIGHSLGGQILGLTPGNERVSMAAFVASGSGYWRENAYPLRRYSWWLWHVVAPLATALCGYFPGRHLRLVGDLPAGVIRQWSRWCRNPDYAAGAEGDAAREAFRRVSLPLLSLSFTDDEFMSERSISALLGAYENAGREMRRLAPDDIGLGRIGHLGFFRKDLGSRLWPLLEDWARSTITRGGNRDGT